VLGYGTGGKLDRLRLMALAVLALGTTAFLWPQAEQRKFDVVSVKPFVPTGPYSACSSRGDSGLLTRTNCNLQRLVEQAYGLKKWQVQLKSPAWADQYMYTIQARTTTPATPDEMKVMLQSLLAERFHLKIHWENPRATVYFLQVAGHGVKLGAATDTTHCGEVSFRDGIIKANCMGTDGIAEILQNSVLNQPVVNRTGLGGDKKYKVDLEFADSDDTAAGASIFSALPDQLGLLLKAGKAPIKTLVIDSAQRPEPN
jgi:uncharacterized protein (TIGR03435 family)